jgi:hypothetical protein
MSTQRRLGWVVTGVMAVLMLMSAVPDVLRIPDAIACSAISDTHPIC